MIDRKILRKSRKDKGILNKRTTAEKVVYSIVFVIFVLYAASLIVPFIWVIIQ